MFILTKAYERGNLRRCPRKKVTGFDCFCFFSGKQRGRPKFISCLLKSIDLVAEIRTLRDEHQSCCSVMN